MSDPKKPTVPRAPTGLKAGGRSLWKAVVDVHHLDGLQLVQLTEACRQKDRLDKLDAVLRGDVSTWTEIVTDSDGTPVSLMVSGVLSKANETANTMKQLLAALRLPDEATGARPQRRGPRGAQKPTVAGGATVPGKVSSLDRARARAEAKTGA